ncbi:MAG TPA: ABC transporter ATP-binding protein [Vicinamibacteria bacterium]|nr:ABC transporter ATP-binding protein [Vicinamibacteria bacterium]
MGIVEVKGIARQFGSVAAVRDVSFSMERGQVLGFIGANGAGKTTTMRIMATLDLPDAGTVRVCGHDAVNYPDRVRDRIGWMPDSYGSYPHTTVWEYLDFFARAFGLKGRDRERAVEDVIVFTDIDELRDREMSALSKGMSQRLCLGRALLNDPEVLILDEPAAGLDPKARVEFKRLVRLLAEDGKTIFISSHILSELEEMCDSVLFIDDGCVVHHGSAESLKLGEEEGASYLVSVASAPGVLVSWVELNPGVAVVETTRTGARLRLSSADPNDAAAVLRRMVMDGIPVVEFRREEKKLEQAFIDRISKKQWHS